MVKDDVRSIIEDGMDLLFTWLSTTQIYIFTNWRSEA